MAARQDRGLLGYIRKIARSGDKTEQTDSQLLERFLKQQDESAFATIIRRHGPLVMGVCRRVLRNEHDAEDAFQATFLVLVRKAASVVPREALANWLYGVAYRTALGARTASTRRRAKECTMLKSELLEEDLYEELRPLLDRELNHLPEKYRLPIVLCDLEGESRKSAAQRLGWSEGTLSGRLARGRAMLARRMARYGLSISGAVMAAALTQTMTSAAVPDALIRDTARIAMLLARGLKQSVGVIPTKVVALTEGVLKSMLIRKLRNFTVAMLVLTATGAMAQWWVRSVLAQNAAQPLTQDTSPGAGLPPVHAVSKKIQPWKQFQEREWLLIGADPDAHTISVEEDDRGHGTNRTPRFILMRNNSVAPFGVSLRGLKVAEKAAITLDGERAKLSELKAGMRVTVRFAGEKPTITQIEASSSDPLSRLYIVKAVNRDKRMLTVTGKGRRFTLEELPIASDSRITLLELSRRNTAALTSREGKLEDLREGMPVALELSFDKSGNLVVSGITAGTIQGK